MIVCTSGNWRSELLQALIYYQNRATKYADDYGITVFLLFVFLFVNGFLGRYPWEHKEGHNVFFCFWWQSCICLPRELFRYIISHLGINLKVLPGWSEGISASLIYWSFSLLCSAESFKNTNHMNSHYHHACFWKCCKLCSFFPWKK